MIMIGDKKKNVINSILGPAPSEEKDEGAPEGESLKACVGELIDAIHAKDVDAAASAFKACFADLESKPHEESGEEG